MLANVYTFGQHSDSNSTKTKEWEWDGYYGGQLATVGVYGWLIETRDAETDTTYQFKVHNTSLR